MTGWSSAAGPCVAVLAVLLVPGPAVAGGVVAGEGPGHRTLFRFTDRSITESSGLVDAGSVVYTMNDSGAGPVLYAVDPRTGDTTGTTTYSSSDVEDVEALAPAPGGAVWVGDIGDNLTRRDEVWLYRVTPGQPDAPRFALTYPGPARDAETLLAQPVTGRLFVVSKSVFGGVVFAAPRSLEPGRSHRLRRFAQVPGLVTDGAFFPDGRHVLLRGYGTAAVYTFPGFALRGRFTLPPQRQGEGVSIGADGRILLSSEGSGAPVLTLELPAGVKASMSDRSAAPATPSAETRGGPAARQAAEAASAATWAWAAGAALAAGLLAVAVVGWRQRGR
jgi:hypothetical protein